MGLGAKANLGFEQEAQMEGLLTAISLREDQCLTYDHTHYGDGQEGQEEDQMYLEVHGSRGYEGILEFTDGGWKEWEQTEWECEILKREEGK